MELNVHPCRAMKGAVNAPPSKSYTHRAIMLAGLSKGEVMINDPLLSEDPLATIDAMRAAGAEIDIGKSQVKVVGNGGEVAVPKHTVDVRNSGTTIRIMSSVFSLCDKKVTLTGDESIRKRPMGPLLEALEGAGVKTASNNGCPPVSVHGPIRGGVIRIRGDVSSQFISGLLIAAPLRDIDNTVIEITTPLKSRPYLDLTLEAMQDFGARAENYDYEKFLVPGRQFYSRDAYTVEGDYSGAAFILGAAALTDSEVTVRNLFERSLQGDRYFIDILKMLGVEVLTRKDGTRVSGGRLLRAIDVDLSQTPDLLPITAVMCSLAKGKSRIHNVEHARIKECDRISAMAQGLKAMGVKLQETPDGLVIEGRDRLNPARIESYADHRIVMAFAVAGLRADGVTTIDKAESVAVSYPRFVEDMRAIEAKMETVA